MIKLVDDAPEQIRRIFDLAIKGKITEYTTLSEMRRIGKTFIKEYSVKASDLKGFSFYEINNFKGSEKDVKLFTLMCTCARFRDEILVIFRDKGGKPKPIKLIRQVSPPLEAYKYIPFNKMDIKPSGRSYGLTFE